MLKKILLRIVLSSVFFDGLIGAEADESFKELSVPYETQENCTQERYTNNIKHQKYIRSDCFTQNSKYYYYLCNSTSSGCTSSGAQALTGTSIINLQIVNPYSVGISSKIIIKLEKISPRIEGLSNEKLSKFDGKINEAIIKYAGNQKAIRILNYLKFEVKNITEQRSKLNGSDDFLCGIIGNCEETNGTQFGFTETIEKALAEQDTKAHGFGLFSNKTLTGSYNGNIVYIVDAGSQTNDYTESSLPKGINNLGNQNQKLKNIDLVYSIRAQTNNHYSASSLSFSTRQPGIGGLKGYEYSISKTPGRLGGSEFKGSGCFATYDNPISGLSVVFLEPNFVSKKPESITNYCIIDEGTKFYINIKIIDNSCKKNGCYNKINLSGLLKKQKLLISPSVQTKDAISITKTTASIRGDIITQNKTGLKASFNFGTSPSTLSTTGDINVLSTWGQVYNKRKNLTPGTKYYYQAVLKAQDGKIINSGVIKNFTTLGGQVQTTIIQPIQNKSCRLADGSSIVDSGYNTTYTLYNKIGCRVESNLSCNNGFISDAGFSPKRLDDPEEFYKENTCGGTHNPISITPPIVVPPSNNNPGPSQSEIARYEGLTEYNTISGLQKDSSNGIRIRKGGYTLNTDGSCPRYSGRNIYTGKCTCSSGYGPIRDKENEYGSKQVYVCINNTTGVVNGSCSNSNGKLVSQAPKFEGMCSSGVPSRILEDPKKIFSTRSSVDFIWGNYEGIADGSRIKSGDNYTWRWSCNGIGPGASKSNLCNAKYEVVAKEAVCGDMDRTKSKTIPMHNLCNVGTVVESPIYNGRGVWNWYCVGEGYGIPELCKVIKEDRVTTSSGTSGKQCETAEGNTIQSGDSKILFNPLTSAFNFSLVGSQEATCKGYLTSCKDGVLTSQVAQTEYNTLWFEGAKWYTSKVSCLKKVPGRNKQLSFQTKLGKNKNAHYSYALNYSDVSNVLIDISRYNDVLDPARFNKTVGFNFKSLDLGKCTPYTLHGSGQIIIGNKNYFQTHLKFCKENGGKLGIYHKVKIKNAQGQYVFGNKVLRHGIIELKQGAQITNVGEFVK